MPRQAETRRSGRKSCSVAWVNSHLIFFIISKELKTKKYTKTSCMGQLTLKWLISKSNNSTWHNTIVTMVCLVMLGKKGKNESGLNPRSGLKKKFFHNTIQYYRDNSLFSNVQFNPRFGLEKKFLPAPFQLLRLRFQIISLLPEIFFHTHYENYYKKFYSDFIVIFARLARL